MAFRLLDLPTELIVLIVGSIDHFPTVLNLLESKEIRRKIARHTTIVYNGRPTVFRAFKDTFQTVSLSNMELRGWPTDPLSILLIEDYAGERRVRVENGPGAEANAMAAFGFDEEQQNLMHQFRQAVHPVVSVTELLKKYHTDCSGRVFLHLRRSQQDRARGGASTGVPWWPGLSLMDNSSPLAAVHLNTMSRLLLTDRDQIPQLVKRGRVSFGTLDELEIAGLELDDENVLFHVDRVKKLKLIGCGRNMQSVLLRSLRRSKVDELAVEFFRPESLIRHSHFLSLEESLEATSLMGTAAMSSDVFYFGMVKMRISNPRKISLGVVCQMEDCEFEMGAQDAPRNRQECTMDLYIGSRGLPIDLIPTIRNVKMHNLKHLALTCVGKFPITERVELPSLTSLELRLITVEWKEMFSAYPDQSTAVQQLFGQSPITRLKVNSKKALVACARILPKISNLEFYINQKDLQTLPDDLFKEAPDALAMIQSDACSMEKLHWTCGDTLNGGQIAVIGEAFPNLQTLDIESGVYRPFSRLEAKSKPITTFRKLKDLCFKGGVNPDAELESMFAGTVFPMLETLKASFSLPSSNSGDVYVFSINAPLLRTLEYVGSKSDKEVALKLYNMPSLKQLKVSNANYLCIAGCPQLERLTLGESERHTRSIYFGSNVISLKKVVYTGVFYCSMPPNIITLEDRLPNLDNISLDIYDKTLHVRGTLGGYMRQGSPRSRSRHLAIKTMDLPQMESVGITKLMRNVNG